jgi:hypothetical protein
MHEAIFTLRQETPIIHFLHDQPGATIRATELKPKLDKFILGDFLKINRDAANEFAEIITNLRQVVDEKKPSLYQISIQQPINEPKFYYFESRFSTNETEYLAKLLKQKLGKSNLDLVSGPFFANNDKRNDAEKKGKEEKWEEIRLGIQYKEGINVLVKSWDSKLISLIQKALPLLFCIENFGMRQSKGFGCFASTDVSEQTFEQAVKSSFAFVAKRPLPNGQTNIFKVIDETYKDLRNRPPRQEDQEARSLLRDYFRKQDPEVEWEKETITRILIHEEGEQPDPDVRFVRVLLGLPGLHDYPQSPGRPKVKICEKSGVIERFRSPITFKVHGNSLYLLARPTDPGMLGKAFQFYRGENPNSDNQAFVLHSPKSFDIKDFLSKNLRNWNHV